jgi:hypothetical protein
VPSPRTNDEEFVEMKCTPFFTSFAALTLGAGTLLAPRLAHADEPAPATTAPSPATPPPAATGASVSLGTEGANASATAPTATPAPEEKKEEKKPEPSWIDRFGGSSLFSQTSMNFNTLFPNRQQTRNVTVDQFIAFQPRFSINKLFQVRARLPFAYEYTNSDATTYRHEAELGDTTLSLWFRGIPAFGGIKLQPNVSFLLPTSKLSRARSLYFTPGVGLQGSYSKEHVLGGDFAAIVALAYQHPIWKSTTPGFTDLQYRQQTVGQPATGAGYSPGIASAPGPQANVADGTSQQLNGLANVSDSLVWSVILTQEWGDWSPGIFFSMSHQFAYTFKDSAAQEGRLEDRTKIRQAMNLFVWLDYHLNDWLTPELGYSLSQALVNPTTGSFGNPLYGRYVDSRLYLGFNIQIDSLYKSIIGAGGEAGVVRAKNKTPIQLR